MEHQEEWRKERAEARAAKQKASKVAKSAKVDKGDEPQKDCELRDNEHLPAGIRRLLGWKEGGNGGTEAVSREPERSRERSD